MHTRRRSIKKLKLNEEGRYSITRPYEAKQIIKIMKKFTKTPLEKLVITDATSCVGGDLVNFSRKFNFVNGVEINPSNFNLLLENTIGINNINLINDDYLTVYDKLGQDVIYMDPPWTGPGYKNKESIILKLSGVKLSDVIEKIRKKHITKYIFIKVPLNVCLDGIKYNYLKTIYKKTRVASFMLVCIKI